MKITDNILITIENRIIDTNTDQWIQPEGYRSFSPGQFFLTEQESTKTEIKTTETKLLLKTKDGYLYTVWENWDDDENYNFTSNPVEAYDFTPFDETKPHSQIPQYLGHLSDDPIDTLEQACAFVGGKMAYVTIDVVTTWTEADYTRNQTN